ncbi:hypothetical protein J1N35_000715 [Gossypium stocksii]|uniref:Uncharacterized protein n=1 Tax=Gossypium stocksii TaxID=47602 RepID=A0A9D3WHL6_9ROSI|nr:hypothetical protein J1N35_000715 [Gossypium stocksii]
MGQNDGQTLRRTIFDIGIATLVLGCHDIEPPLPRGCKNSTRNKPGADCRDCHDIKGVLSLHQAFKVAI